VARTASVKRDPDDETFRRLQAGDGLAAWLIATVMQQRQSALAQLLGGQSGVPKHACAGGSDEIVAAIPESR
jgi:hypothetical protein